jgi:tRNA A-37 threonylcarbamoyl transferase component Bud32
MALPRLRADLHDQRAVARLLRGALRHEIELVPLSVPAASVGQHLLEVVVEGAGVITLLAEPVSVPTAEGQALRVRPVTRGQMASLLELVERLDGPSRTVPPPDGAPLWDASGPTAEDSTLMDHPEDRLVLAEPAFGAPGGFGVLDSLVPAPLSQPTEPPPVTLPPPLPSLPPALIGRVLAGKYRIEAEIGSGSTAAVFRAIHADLRRPVAVKILHAHKLGERQFVKRFEAEALSASKLEHMNVTRVIDYGQEPDGLLYLVMELLVGTSLEAILSAQGKLGQSKAVAIAIQACSALAYAHDDGIIHRDVKPENIMLVSHRDDDGQPCDLVKVCDFGLAKLRSPDAEHADLTTMGMLCGSPAYMSPEQTRGEELDCRSDVYSLGVTLFQSLTGELPHEAETLPQLFIKIMLHPARRPSALVPDLDPLLDDIVVRALATDRNARHATARILREELREALANLDVASEQPRETILVG